MSATRSDWLECPACNGTGENTEGGCSYCAGRGRIPPEPEKYRPCGQCDGTGYLVWGNGEVLAHVTICPCAGEGCDRCGGVRLQVLDVHGCKIGGAVADECFYCGASGLVLCSSEDA